MAAYLVRRLLLLIPVLIGISILIFTLTRVGGDPATAYINERMSDQQIHEVYARYHFDDPPWTQYYYWLNGILNGDLGFSTVDNRPVAESLALYFPATFELATVSMFLGAIIGISAGTLSATKKDRPVDYATRFTALVGVSLPIFIMGLLLLSIFSLGLGLFPLGNEYSDRYVIDNLLLNRPTGFYLVDTVLNGRMDMFMDGVWHLILPAVTLSFGIVAVITRMMRSSMLEVMDLEYVNTARAKGLSERAVIRRHVRRNSLLPTTTFMGLAFGSLLGGAVLTEAIFSWPGLGRWATRAIINLDTAAIMGFVLMAAFVYVIANLAIDVIYAFIDPRVDLG
jgi:peptide/nickel transport system permease protein